MASTTEGKFKRAIDACDSRDVDGLCWELIRTTVTELDTAQKPTLGDSVLMELIKTISAGIRSVGRGKAKWGTDTEDDGIREWLREIESKKKGKRL